MQDRANHLHASMHFHAALQYGRHFQILHFQSPPVCQLLFQLPMRSLRLNVKFRTKISLMFDV